MRLSQQMWTTAYPQGGSRHQFNAGSHIQGIGSTNAHNLDRQLRRLQMRLLSELLPPRESSATAVSHRLGISAPIGMHASSSWSQRDPCPPIQQPTSDLGPNGELQPTTVHEQAHMTRSSAFAVAQFMPFCQAENGNRTSPDVVAGPQLESLTPFSSEPTTGGSSLTTIESDASMQTPAPPRDQGTTHNVDEAFFPVNFEDGWLAEELSRDTVCNKAYGPCCCHECYSSLTAQ